MLQPLDDQNLKELASVSAYPCVSILMRTHRSGRETQQGPIRLKNLLKEASEKLKAAGHDDGILDELASKTNQHDFWQHQGEGLAIYLTPDDYRMFRLNHSVDEQVYIGEMFLLQPLVRESNSTGKYFVLSLSWEEAKLYRADSTTFNLVETTALPAKFHELVLPRDPEESLQNTSHRSVGNTVGTSTAMFHGQGEGEDMIAADRDQYLSLIGDEVTAAIYNTGLPLVVVATHEVTGHFEATTKVQVDARVDGSPSEWSSDEMQKHAHTAIEPLLQANHSEFIERFGTTVAESQGSDDLDEVLQAAKNGRIDSLMACNHADHCDKTNQAVVETLRGGGNVLQGDQESMPGDDAVIAAIFRY
ncbi:hypothetical protein GCM10023156_58470 [Novipirellula rosea]|uniref:Uncharacterized protein n=2 Tax=Novipirellula rosea TaxID=1031540 RepID=A0ABP8NLS6_9BACT